MKGIDVSKYQGEIQWEKVAAAGIRFAIIRSSYGREAHQVDPFFRRNVVGAQQAGLAIGAYHYSYAKTVEQARQEAEFFLQTVQGLPLTLPLYYDLEDSSQAHLGKKQITAIAAAFCAKVNQTGYSAGIYANLSWLTVRLEMKELPYSLWLAQWAEKPSYGGAFDLWQYSDQGEIPGIKGPVDLNVCQNPGLLA